MAAAADVLEQRLMLSAQVFVNDGFTQPVGTLIPDADPNTVGNQPATIGTDAFATIQEGVNAADPDGTVFITDDLATDGPGLYSENVVIANNVSIVGTEGDAAAVVIDGRTGGSVFTIGADEVSLIALTIQNGSAANGGGILSNGDVLIIRDSIIRDNVAANSGGGIENSGGLMLLVGSTLTGNSASVSGGGLHNSGSAKSILDSSLVEGNLAGDSGGGLANSVSGLLIVRNGSTVSNNSASGSAIDQGGGGIFNDGGRLAIYSGATITGNAASGSGGGIFTAGGVVTVQDSAVRGNTVDGHGGGIEMLTGVVELRDVDLDSNSAGLDGGGLHVSGRNGVVGYVRIFGGAISGNTAAFNGGGLWHQAGNVMVIRNGAVLDGNSASGDAADQGGGGIFNNGGRLALGEGAQVSNNEAHSGSGGGIFSMGGAVSIEGGSTITGNTADRVGGGIEIVSGLVDLIDSTIDDNHATGLANGPGSGGGLHLTGSSMTRIDLRNSLVSNNTAALEGGGLWHQTGSVMLVRSGTQVVGNTALGDAADDGGGGIFNNGGRLAIHTAVIDGNSARGTEGSGGGLLTLGGVTTVEDSTISHNMAHRAGGGIELVDGWVFTRNMELVSNDAGGAAPSPGHGGGLHVTGNSLSRVRINGGTVSDNTASGQGGGLWHQMSSILVVFGGATINGNSALGNSSDGGGGGIFNSGGRVAITSSTIADNSASGTDADGGGILSVDGGLTLDISTISGNTANGSGGGLVSNGELIAANVTIANNRSDADGLGGGQGGGFANGGRATLLNSLIAGNLLGTGGTRSDMEGNFLRPSSAHNLISDAVSSGGLTDGVSGNIVGNKGTGNLPVSTLIQTLAANGGLAATHALASNSPARNTGNNTLARNIYGTTFPQDERGAGFPRISDGTVDIGAFESQFPIILEEDDQFVVERTIPIPLGETEGGRRVRIEIEPDFDTSDSSSVSRDVFSIYLVDAADPSQTLLDRGEPGSALFSLTEGAADFIPGLVTYDGRFIEIDVTAVTEPREGLLKLQLLNTDEDINSVVRVVSLVNESDEDGEPPILLSNVPSPASPGPALDLSLLNPSSDLEVAVSNVRFDSDSNLYRAQLKLRNIGTIPLSRTLALVLNDLPDGVEVENASGMTAEGNSYINFSTAVASGGLGVGQLTSPIELIVHNPQHLRFSLNTSSLAAGPNRAPEIVDPGPLSVTPGETLSIPLQASDADGDGVSFSIASNSPLPNVTLNARNRLIVQPTPEHVGDYEFELIARDGAAETRQRVTISVVVDPVQLTRISGRILSTDGSPIPGIDIELGRFRTTTAADGSFTIELPSFVSPTEPFDIVVPPGDPMFDPFNTGTQTIDLRRAGFDLSTGTSIDNPRLHQNLVTAFLDGSVVYGSELSRATALRTLTGDGKLKVSDGNLLPRNHEEFFPEGSLENENSGMHDPGDLFAAGDVRANDNVDLLALQTLFVREHNRKAEELATADPTLTDDELYEGARRWVIALLQHITYSEFLPILLGAGAIPDYTEYDSTVDPQISGGFSGAAFRIGHSMASDDVLRLDENGESLPGGPLSLTALSDISIVR